MQMPATKSCLHVLKTIVGTNGAFFLLSESNARHNVNLGTISLFYSIMNDYKIQVKLYYVDGNAADDPAVEQRIRKTENPE